MNGFPSCNPFVIAYSVVITSAAVNTASNQYQITAQIISFQPQMWKNTSIAIIAIINIITKGANKIPTNVVYIRMVR